MDHDYDVGLERRLYTLQRDKAENALAAMHAPSPPVSAHLRFLIGCCQLRPNLALCHAFSGGGYLRG